MTQAGYVMGLDDSGKGSIVGSEGCDCGKRKRDESGSGAGGMFAMKRYFYQ